MAQVAMGISMFSGVLLSMVGLFICYNKKFKDHPYWLISWCCLSIGMVLLNQYNYMLMFNDHNNMILIVSWQIDVMNAFFSQGFGAAYETLIRGAGL